MREVGYVLGLAWGRVRRRSSGALLAASGIAIGTAVLVGVLAGTKVAQDRSASLSVQQIPASARAVRAVWFGVPVGAAEQQPALDRAVRDELREIGLAGPTPIALFRESTVAGRFVSLAAVDGLAPYVQLKTGRLPRPCTALRCEVLRLRGEGALPDAPGLRLVQVGTGVLRSRQLFGDFLAPTDNALADREIAPSLQRAASYHRPQPAPLVVADGIAPLTVAPALSHTYRSYAWVWPLANGTPRLWDFSALVERSDRARVALATRSTGFSVDAPIEELRAAERATTVAGRRLLLVGGEAAALLFAFAVLAARTMRRDLHAARRRLTWYGARRWQLSLLAVAESAAVGLLGTLVGWAVGLAAGAVAASRAGAPVGAVLRESVLAPLGIALALAVAAIATLVIVLAVSVEVRGGRRFGALDAAAAGAVIVVIVALLGGVADESRLASGQGAGLVLLLLPGLISFAGAVAAARLFGPLVQAAGRRLPGSVGLRLATVTLGRGPGAAAVTVAFLVLAFALAVLAEGYRATLHRAESDQAAFQVPLDVVVREDLARLVPVLDAATLARYRQLGGGIDAVPVLRIASSAGKVEGITGVTVLGLPPEAIARLHGWRSDFSETSRTRLAAAISAPRRIALAGIPIGPAVTLQAGKGLVSIVATIAAPDGSFVPLQLGSLDGERPTTLHVAVPKRLRDGLLVDLQIVPPKLQDRGADAGGALEGTLLLTGLPLGSWVGEGGIRATPVANGISLQYRITFGSNARVRAVQPTDANPPRVLATPRIVSLAGGVGGTLPLKVGGSVVPVRIAGSFTRFPGVRGEAVVGAVDALETAIDTQVPGAGRTNELWLDVPDGREASVAAALREPPFTSVDVVSRESLVAAARSDPLGHGTLLALAAAAFVALVLAAVGLTLSVLGDLRDDRGDLYDLEAQGAQPSLLRRVVRVRALVIATFGLVAGAAAGAFLALLITRVVSVTAGATTAEPPLATAFDARIVGIGAVAFLVVAGLLVGLATRAAFHDSRGPGRAQEADA